MLALCRSCSPWRSLPTKAPRTTVITRHYAISVQPPKLLPGKQMPRVFRDKKAYQYNWYTNILKTNTTTPILFLNHDQFSAEKLIKLRKEILLASRKATVTPTPVAGGDVHPTLTVIRTSIFGAALRDLPGINIDEVEKMLNGLPGNFAVLSLPSFNPPQLNAILRAMDRTIPPRKPKTPQQLLDEANAKNADPESPGRRMKRLRATLIPELKVVGALIEGKVFLPSSVKEVAKLPTLDTLRAQIVGLLSAPATQLAGVLNEAGGAKVARTLEGLKKALEEEEKGVQDSTSS
ncbi:hypothetical protein BDN72DRAFT_818763 [Pluteus cervinus]|uniref:Uncharacterized protein n=1 Tax=Pluteus cervinus TaxID=181527 RepID=A0ACD3AYN3_9AGAR|nr:hypothetical protein BDN72DRAFT_818763 [Pluteus cervinus]